MSPPRGPSLGGRTPEKGNRNVSFFPYRNCMDRRGTPDSGHASTPCARGDGTGRLRSRSPGRLRSSARGTWQSPETCAQPLRSGDGITVRNRRRVTRLDAGDLCPADPFASSPASSITSPIAPTPGATLFESRDAYARSSHSDRAKPRPSDRLGCSPTASCRITGIFVLWPETDDAVRALCRLALADAREAVRTAGGAPAARAGVSRTIRGDSGRNRARVSSSHSIRRTEPLRGAPGVDGRGHGTRPAHRRDRRQSGWPSGRRRGHPIGWTTWKPRSSRPSSRTFAGISSGSPCADCAVAEPTDSTGEDCQPTSAVAPRSSCYDSGVVHESLRSRPEPLRSRPATDSGVVGLSRG